MGNLACDVLFHISSTQRYTFCLLIVRYMLSDKIKSKRALKARIFYMYVTKVICVIGMGCPENIAGYLQHVQIKTLH